VPRSGEGRDRAVGEEGLGGLGERRAALIHRGVSTRRRRRGGAGAARARARRRYRRCRG
jgi:hypothetical protein